MKVKRIVANIDTPDIAAAKRFYQDVLGLDLVMDLGLIATYGSSDEMRVQISFAEQGGSGTPVPDLSIEVDDVDAALEAMKKAGLRDRVRSGRRAVGRQALLSCATRSASWSTSSRIRQRLAPGRRSRLVCLPASLPVQRGRACCRNGAFRSLALQMTDGSNFSPHLNGERWRGSEPDRGGPWRAQDAAPYPPCFSRNASADRCAEIVERGAQPRMVPVPPGERLVALGGPAVEALADRLCRHAADDRVGRDILRHDRAGADRRAVADRDAGQDGRAVAEPGVVADGDALGAAPGEEVALVLGVVPIVGGAVGEVVQRRPPGRVVGGVDAHGGGDVGELADRRAPDAAVLHHVGIVAERRLSETRQRSAISV